jgi:hypothetical protein
MVNELLPLIVGFLLSTVLGGILGYYFQNRAWRHQNNAKVLEAELQTALKVFEDVSELMDKRLYRMRLLFWRLNSAQSDQDAIEKYMELYREVLYEWNSNLNRNLALIQCYFGSDIRKKIDYEIYEQFRNIGQSLEKAYLARKTGHATDDLETLGHALDVLGHENYQFNIRVITLIQHRQVGIFNPDKEESNTPAKKE